MNSLRHFTLLACLTTFSLCHAADNSNITEQIKAVKSVGPKGQGHRTALKAMQRLSQTSVESLPTLLSGMDGASPLAENWLRAAAESVTQRGLKEGKSLPIAELMEFLNDKSHSPRARRLAYELIAKVDDDAEAKIIPSMLNDPSLEMRRDAVAMVIERAKRLMGTDAAAGKKEFRRALDSARHIDQIQEIAKTLRESGETVDLPQHFGFVMNWHVAAPFDNSEMKGFDVAYAPEEEVDLNDKLSGKDDAAITWKPITSKSELGLVDLNKEIGKVKGAIAYAYADFNSAADRPAELRLGCINANKIWLNGKLLTANNVNHSGEQIDQYIGRGALKKGKNRILVKICQNEQTEPWAQRWQFQLRVCDNLGTAILSTDRPATSGEALGASNKE